MERLYLVDGYHDDDICTPCTTAKTKAEAVALARIYKAQDPRFNYMEVVRCDGISQDDYYDYAERWSLSSAHSHARTFTGWNKPTRIY